MPKPSTTAASAVSARDAEARKNIERLGTQRPPNPPRGRFSLGNAITLALLLTPPTLAVWRLFPTEVAAAISGWVVFISVITFFVYAYDKRQARTAEWRTPEKSLHLWEFFGGWPGAFIAQRALRHKCSKVSFLVVFWLIVAAHLFVSIDIQLDWKATRAVRTAFDQQSTRHLK